MSTKLKKDSSEAKYKMEILRNIRALNLKQKQKETFEKKNKDLLEKNKSLINYNSAVIKVPDKMMFKNKNNSYSVVDALTKKGNLTKKNNLPSIQLQRSKFSDVAISESGTNIRKNTF